MSTTSIGQEASDAIHWMWEQFPPEVQEAIESQDARVIREKVPAKFRMLCSLIYLGLTVQVYAERLRADKAMLSDDVPLAG